MLIDTHAHLCDPVFADDLDEVIERALAADVRAVVAVGETLAEAERNLVLASRFPGVVRPAAGLFPTLLDRRQAEDLAAWIRQHRDQLVAIGEVGLDRWKVQDEADRRLQRDIFGLFVELAMELDLPLNVHSRAAGRQTIQMLLDLGATRVQLHAFDGRAARAEPAVEAGYFFSVPPSIGRSPQKQKLIRRLPLSSLLVETDSPVLGPAAADRNEPANVWHSVRAIAELKNLPLPEVTTAVTDNTLRLYGTGLTAPGPRS